MKNLYNIFLLICGLSYAQMPLDSTVVRKLEFMHYLDQEALMADIHKPNVIEHFTQVLANNPVPELNINEYLGIKGFPKTIDQFTNKVAESNAENLLKIIYEYGYPSFDRLKILLPGKEIPSAVTFIYRAPDDWKKEFKKIIKQEYKLGNMSAKDYEMSMLFIRKAGQTITKEDFDKVGMKLKTP
ncbi:MAG: hypothetical protein ACO1N9_10590 [Flavobacterium sp.]